MAATTGGAIKAYLESRSYGFPVFRDGRVPPDAPLPHVTVRDSISIDPDSDGRGGKRDGRMRGVREQVQVSLWDRMRPDGDLPGEDYWLPSRLTDDLDGAHLTAAPTVVFGVTVGQTVRLPEPDTNVVQHAVTLTIHRERVPR